MCEDCYGNEVIYKYYVNEKLKEVASDFIYCPACFPNSIGCFKCPWDTDYEIITVKQYNNYIKEGYIEIN